MLYFFSLVCSEKLCIHSFSRPYRVVIQRAADNLRMSPFYGIFFTSTMSYITMQCLISKSKLGSLICCRGSWFWLSCGSRVGKGYFQELGLLLKPSGSNCGPMCCCARRACLSDIKTLSGKLPEALEGTVTQKALGWRDATTWNAQLQRLPVPFTDPSHLP